VEDGLKKAAAGKLAVAPQTNAGGAGQKPPGSGGTAVSSPGGDGPFRGGRHGQMKRPVGDNLVSHHMPANSINGLLDDRGPAIQMELSDHLKTGSHPKQGLKAKAYREEQQELIRNGEFGKAIQ